MKRFQRVYHWQSIRAHRLKAAARENTSWHGRSLYCSLDNDRLMMENWTTAGVRRVMIVPLVMTWLAQKQLHVSSMSAVRPNLPASQVIASAEFVDVVVLSPALVL